MEYPDMIAIDREDRPILLAEVKSHRVPPEDAREIIDRLRAMRSSIPLGENVVFGMIVDPETISLYDFREESSPKVGELNTVEVFEQYSSSTRKSLANPFVARDFLESLINAWIRDMIFHWKMVSPPGSEVLASAGLLEKLEGGWMERYATSSPVDAVY